jgi:maltodextrin utilization protein YvdJ
MNMLLVIVLGVLVFVALILIVLIGGNWLSWFFRRPKPRSADSFRETRERLLNPH